MENTYPVAILSTENLLHNLQVIRRMAPGSKIIACLKANAYGHGIRSVGRRLDGLVEMIGVARVEEGIALRKAGILSEIMLLEGAFTKDEQESAVMLGFHLVFHNEVQLEWLDSVNHSVKAWMKIDTGFGRLGFDMEHAAKAYELLIQHRSTGGKVNVLSHFSCAPQKEHPNNLFQINNFNRFRSNSIISDDTEYSFCNSAGILNFPEVHLDYVRPGIFLYGASSINGISGKDLGLKPVMTVKSSIISIKELSRGESIGYDAKYVCDDKMKLGIVAFGYGDGYPLTDDGYVLVNDVKCTIVGAVSMDMLAIDLTKCEGVQLYDEALLWGEKLPPEKIVERGTQDQIWKILASVQNRVKFIWI